MFVDETVLKVIAGKGGDGCTSFRHEKYIEMGGPDGGNGGKGADIIFKVDKNLSTLVDLRYNKTIKGDKGVNGKGSNRHGANAEDVIIKVPEGTTIYDMDTNLVIADLTEDGEEFIVAHGGRGGRGNKAFATQQEPAPRMSEYGEPGEYRKIKCELKVMADVGLIGMPSVGKSTLLSAISNAKPKIASYHFTTLSPNLGVIKLNDGRSFVMADLPGLIEGAAEGVGLGHKFLKHAMRTRILAHVIDMGSFEGRDPIDDYKTIKNEYEKYSDKLKNKKEIIIANKADLPNFEENLNKFKKEFPKLEVIPISALEHKGLSELMTTIADELESLPKTNIYDENEFESFIMYKFQDEKPYTIRKEDDAWIVEGPEITKLFEMTKFTEDESTLRFARKLRGMGIEDELEALGAKRGDDVVIEDYVFTFKE